MPTVAPSPVKTPDAGRGRVPLTSRQRDLAAVGCLFLPYLTASQIRAIPFHQALNAELADAIDAAGLTRVNAS